MSEACCLRLIELLPIGYSSPDLLVGCFSWDLAVTCNLARLIATHSVTNLDPIFRVDAALAVSVDSPVLPVSPLR